MADVAAIELGIHRQVSREPSRLRFELFRRARGQHDQVSGLCPMLRLERVPLDGVDPAIDDLRTRNVFQTREWLEFVERTQGAEPVVAHVERDGEVVGAFTGLIVKRFGVRILGSPFQGWMTGPMGFSLDPDVPRPEAMKALVRFAFRKLGCLHVELMDRHTGFEELGGLRARLVRFPTYELDLTQDEEAIFGGMTSACRRAIRKSERVGVRVEVGVAVTMSTETKASSP